MKKLFLLVTLIIFITGCSSAYKNSMKQGNEALEAQEYENAVSAFEEALNEKPDDDEALKGLEMAKNEIDRILNEKEEERRKEEELKKKEVEKAKKKEQSVLESSKNVLYEIFKFGDDEIDETIVNIEFNESDKSLIATVKGKDGWSDKSIGDGFYMDSTAAYRELAKDERIDEAWITITFPMKDEYGKVTDEEVMGTWMSRETMNKIDWKNFDYKKLLDVVDGKRIYPQFVQ